VRQLVLILISAALLTCAANTLAATPSQHSAIVATATTPSAQVEKSRRATPEGQTGKTLAAGRKKRPTSSAYTRWKRHLPYWPRKGVMLAELLAYIIIGVLIGQALEVSGCVRWLSVLTLPLTGLGRLSREAGPAFLMAFQSGAVANSMLASHRDTGQISNRELYTSIYVVSALSLFAHLPTFIVPIGLAFGWEATAALFGVRVVAIIAQIVVTLLVSRLIVLRLGIGEQHEVRVVDETDAYQPRHRKRGTFWATVWKRSHFTLTRLIVYLIPTFVVMAGLEYYGAFAWLAQEMPGLFTFDFLPVQSLVVIPAQALSLYNGAIAAANFIDSGAITTQQAVIIILFGSMVTAPLRTLRHALPTYVAILGPRPGLIMAVSAQVLRMMFLLVCTLGLMSFWS